MHLVGARTPLDTLTLLSAVELPALLPGIDHARAQHLMNEAHQTCPYSKARRGDATVTLVADYIVLGSHGHGAFYELIAGSTTTRVLRQARCPVVVVPQKKTGQ